MFGTPRVMGVLNLTRALGDWYLRPYISQTPTVTQHPIAPGNVIVLASDGLWDVVHPFELHDLVRWCPQNKTLPEYLVTVSTARGSLDNTTVVHLTFDDQNTDQLKNTKKDTGLVKINK